MLAALEESARSQRQFVADASHELRTPLTSLRTNIEVLARDESMAPDERERLLGDVVEQLEEMSALITELVELAREEQEAPEGEDVRLDLVAAEAVERARRNRPTVTFELDAAETLVHGVPGQIERAISNLLDNAAKWSPNGGPVEVEVRDGQVTVRDHGPGIAEEDLPHVFDNFYRAPCGPRHARLGARPRDRPPRGGVERRQRHRGARGRRRHGRPAEPLRNFLAAS